MNWASKLIKKSSKTRGRNSNYPFIYQEDLSSAVLKKNEEIMNLTTKDGFQDFNKRYQLWARAFTELYEALK